MKVPARVSTWFFLTLFSSLMLVACGGGSSGGSGSLGGDDSTGTVALVVTDAISDEFDEIWITITEAALLGDEDPVPLFEGELTLDLLALEDYSDLLAIEDGIAAGEYSKIRLYISSIEMIEYDDEGEIVRTEYPSLPANGKIDLNPQGSFLVLGGETLTVELDIDANKSIHVVGTGTGGYQFRPVIFVNILTDDELGLVRLSGDIEEVDETGTLLCMVTGFISDGDAGEDQDDCVQVSFSEDTGFFDEFGLAINVADLAIGDSVYVIGLFEESDDDFVQLEALMIQQGNDSSAVFYGEVTEAYDEISGQLALVLEPGQGFEPETIIPVVIDPATAIFDEEGELLSPGELEVGDPLEIDAVLALSELEADVLRALAILRNDSAMDEDDSDLPESVEGTISEINPETGVIIIDPEELEAEAACVVSDGENVFLVTSLEDGFESDLIELSDLTVGMEIEAFISDVDGDCYVADSIIAEAED